jgi:hypothetical protein
MEHRRPSPDCPLCPLYGPAWNDEDPETHGRQHDHARALWACWDERRGWADRVVAAAAKLGVVVTPSQVREHFKWHEIEQPHPGRLSRPNSLLLAQDLDEVERLIIQTIHRQRILSRDQLTELFWAGRYSSQETIRRIARRTLNGLARDHFLYRYFAPREWVAELPRRRGFLIGGDANQGQPLFLLGKTAIPLLEADGVKVGEDAATSRAAQVGVGKINHDVRAAQVYVTLQRSLREHNHLLADASGRQSKAFSLIENWHGQRALELRFVDPRSGKRFKMIPDGFATLSLEGSGYRPDDIPACQLPFWIEFNEWKKEKEIAEQLFVFHRLALAGTLGRLFPDLAVEGYAAPIIMVFADQARAAAVQRAFRRYADAENTESGVPIFLTTEEEWQNDPFGGAILQLAWDRGEPRRLSLLDAMLRSNEKLLGPIPSLSPRQVLRHTPEALPKWSYEQHKKAIKV